ncbi:MAG: kynureninase [Terriglobales bacterium]
MNDRWEQARGWARTADEGDRLAPARERFRIPEGVYCCSHSLGLEPRAAAAYVQEVLDVWGERAVEGHHLGTRAWAEYSRPLEAISARRVGAAPEEVAVMNSLTVNLHLMLASFYRPRGERHRILIERHAFPSDRYALASHLRQHGYDPAEALVEAEGGEIEEQIAREGGRLALVLLGGVNYFSGQSFDLAACARAAQAAGATVGFDLAHAIGNVAIDLEAAHADFAVWCGYKYLCGGPGAPGGCYVAARHWTGREALPRLAGWWGNRADTRFEMRDAFEPERGAAGWQVSCPSILSLAGLRAGLGEYAAAAGWEAKRQALTAGVRRWAAALLPEVKVVTPAPGGALVAFELGETAGAVQGKLRAAGVYSDVRGAILRLSFHPLYNRYADVVDALSALADALAA